MGKDQPGLNVKTDDLDTNPWLLNVRNGTIDLRNGTIREHAPADLITHCADVDFDPKADCPTWRQFLLEIMGWNQEMYMFIQKAAGWAITGDTSEQTMFIAKPLV